MSTDPATPADDATPDPDATPAPDASSEWATGQDLLAAGLDLLVVLVFAIIGRASHGEALAVGDVVNTALPFWLGAVIAHIVLQMRHASRRSLHSVLAIWSITWAVGMLGRALLAQGTAPAFLIVAAVALALGMVAWRLVRLARARN